MAAASGKGTPRLQLLLGPLTGLLVFLLGDEKDSVVPTLEVAAVHESSQGNSPHLAQLLAYVVGQPESHFLHAQAVRSWTLLLTRVSTLVVRQQQRLFVECSMVPWCCEP